MKDRIIELLSAALPMVDLESDFLFSELDSLGVTTILMVLSEEYGIELDAKDATPKNLRTIDSIVRMVKEKKTLSDSPLKGENKDSSPLRGGREGSEKRES